MKEKTWKGLVTGMAGGLVAAWSVARFYRMARRSARGEALAPYAVGAAIGAAYGAFILTRDVPVMARIPLGAAVYLGDPESTAAPKGGRNATEKAGNLAARLVSKGLKRVAEKALVA